MLITIIVLSAALLAALIFLCALIITIWRKEKRMFIQEMELEDKLAGSISQMEVDEEEKQLRNLLRYDGTSQKELTDD